MVPVILCTAALTAQDGNSSRRETSKIGAEFSDMAREIRVTRQVREQLEEQASIVEYAVKHEQLNPSELKRIRSVMDRIETMQKKMNQSGKMTVQEAEHLQQELSKAYRMIWFLRRNKLGSSQTIVFLGRKITLREEYRKKYDKGSLNQKEMADILRVYYSAWRIQERMQATNIQPELRKRLEKECFDTLSEYFELAAPAAVPEKK